MSNNKYSSVESSCCHCPPATHLSNSIRPSDEFKNRQCFLSLSDKKQHILPHITVRRPWQNCRAKNEIYCWQSHHRVPKWHSLSTAALTVTTARTLCSSTTRRRKGSSTSPSTTAAPPSMPWGTAKATPSGWQRATSTETAARRFMSSTPIMPSLVLYSHLPCVCAC